MARRINRREMLAASAASLGYLHLAPAFSAVKIQGANGKLRVAGIGVGGKGSSDIDQAGNLMEVVALCDIDAENLAAEGQEVAERQEVLRLPQDVRRDGPKNIDAVTVSTPDHTHALASLLAIRNKKHVYCQKPLTHNVFEAHLMRTEAKKIRRLHADGQPGDGRERAAPGRRAGPGRRPRRRRTKSTSGRTGRSGRRPRA